MAHMYNFKELVMLNYLNHSLNCVGANEVWLVHKYLYIVEDIVKNKGTNKAKRKLLKMQY
jgi:hypothetical protein